MRNKFLLLILAAGLLTACSYQSTGSQEAIDKANLSKAQVQLANAAMSINGSLMELSAIQRAVYPAVKLPDLPNANKIGLGKLASVDWTGPVEPLIKNIASVSHYKVRIIGRVPPLPILVSITKHNVALAVILRDAAFQCGNKVDIVIYPTSRIIELRYANV
jgi:defect in organelle trafficking protein DotD